jgi:2-(3-amino-3-carboxypropyl)histidine synthase
MEILHIQANYTKKIILPKELIQILPKKIILFTTIQYINQVEEIRKTLEKNNIQTILLSARHASCKGQILGCSNTKINNDDYPEDILYIGDGLFHPKAILLKNNKKVFTYNPKTNDVNTLTRKDVSTMIKKIKGSYLKFLTSKNIGVLITTKYGQCLQNNKFKEKIMKKIQEKFKDKNVYFFLDNTYNFQTLKDFNYIDMFLNTMCERIGYDDSDVQGMSILNIEDLDELMNDKFEF